MDFTLVSYKITAIAIMYNFLLFLIWLVMVRLEEGIVSKVYMVIMALFITRFYGVVLGIRARTLRPDHDAYMGFMSGWIWDWRLVPEAVVFIILAYVLTKRFAKSYLFGDPKYRAKNGNRKSDK